MSQENIFISYIYEEAMLAKALKDELETASAGQWLVFASTDQDSITLGDQWAKKIDDALVEHRLLLVLCSPISIKRLWIGYEAGYATAKGVPVIPLCHSDVKPATLPSCLSRYQGIEINAPDFVQKFFTAINKHVPLPRMPRFQESGFNQAIQEALSEIASRPILSIPDVPILPSQLLEEEDCQVILRHLAGTYKGYSTCARLCQELNIKFLRVQQRLDDLCRLGLISQYGNGAGGISCELTEEGRKYVLEKGWV